MAKIAKIMPFNIKYSYSITYNTPQHTINGYVFVFVQDCAVMDKKCP